MDASRDPDEDEMDPYGLMTGVRPRRRGENAGLVYALVLGAFATAFGVKAQFRPGRYEEALATPFLLIGLLLLLAAAFVLTARRGRERDGRWG